MPTYNLIFREDGHGVEKRVELEGQNVACVFSVLEHEAASRLVEICLLYTSPSPRDLSTSRMPSSA